MAVTELRSRSDGDPLDIALDAVEAALSEALAVGLLTVDREGLASAACRLEAAIAAKTAALTARVIAAADDAAVAPLDGLRTTDQLVSARSRVDPGRVRADGRLGRWLEQFPLLAEALATGRVSREHVESLRKADNPRVHLQLVDAQQLFVDAATTVAWRDWPDVVTHWLLTVDPDGAIPREQQARRHISIHKKPDGSISGTFRLDTISGAAVHKAVAFEEQRLLDLDAEDGITRSASQRRVDAFVRVIMRGAARESGALPGPLVHVVLGEELAEELVERAFTGEDTPIVASRTDVKRRCELADGTPVHPNQAMAVLAVAEFIRLVLEPPSRLLELGRSARCFPKDIRLAMLAATRSRCRTPGCDAPPAWMQADHRHPWGHLGDTNPDNGDILCRPDNRHKGNRLD